MTTIAETTKAKALTEDRWRYGWRYVNQVGPDGTETSVQVPLTERDLLFPQEGDFIVNDDPHHKDLDYLYGVFTNRLRDDPGAVVLGDCRVDFNLEGVEPLGPDVIVLSGCWNKHPTCGTFDIRAEGGRPILVVEITSESTRENDFVIKKDYYERAAVSCYVIVDDREDDAGQRTLRLHGWQHTAAGWVQLAPNEQGWLWVEPVQLWLGVCPANVDRPYIHVRCFERDGTPVATWEEECRARAEAESRAAADAQVRRELEQRLREMEEEIKRLRGPE